MLSWNNAIWIGLFTCLLQLHILLPSLPCTQEMWAHCLHASLLKKELGIEAVWSFGTQGYRSTNTCNDSLMCMFVHVMQQLASNGTVGTAVWYTSCILIGVSMIQPTYLTEQ